MIDNLEYNTEREHLIIPEYGRHLQKMINHAKTRETKEEREKLAKAIISVMGNLQPHLRDVPDFQHKLWDQLFIMSNFELDVDSPYPIPTKETFETKPEKVPYPSGKARYGHYGKVIEDFVQRIDASKDEEERKLMVNVTANLMKRFYLTWNRNSVEDETIVKQLNELGGGKLNIKVEDVDLHDHKDVQMRTNVVKSSNNRGKGGQNRGKKGGGKYQRNNRRR